MEYYGPNCYTVDADGWLRLRGKYQSEAFTLRWLMGFGDRVEVLSPPHFVDAVERVAEAILRRKKKRAVNRTD